MITAAIGIAWIVECRRFGVPLFPNEDRPTPGAREVYTVEASGSNLPQSSEPKATAAELSFLSLRDESTVVHGETTFIKLAERRSLAEQSYRISLQQPGWNLTKSSENKLGSKISLSLYDIDSGISTSGNKLIDFGVANASFFGVDAESAPRRRLISQSCSKYFQGSAGKIVSDTVEWQRFAQRTMDDAEQSA
jgi:hypothetical protein